MLDYVCALFAAGLYAKGVCLKVRTQRVNCIKCGVTNLSNVWRYSASDGYGGDGRLLGPEEIESEEHI